jgi:hypothetical protein
MRTMVSVFLTHKQKACLTMHCSSNPEGGNSGPQLLVLCLREVAPWDP